MPISVDSWRFFNNTVGCVMHPKCKSNIWLDWSHLYDLVAWKRQFRNVGRITRHQIAVKDTEDAFVGDD